MKECNVRMAALVAAAGMSSRMQRFKPLLPVGDKTVIQRVVEGFQQAGADPVLVVTGNNAEQLEPALLSMGAIPLYNPAYRETAMFESLQLGLAQLDKKCDLLFVQPGDVPLVQQATLQALLTQIQHQEEWVLRPTYDGELGHPVLLKSCAITFLLAYQGERGLLGAVGSLPGGVKDLSVGDRGILLDADTQEDYQALLRYYENSF